MIPIGEVFCYDKLATTAVLVLLAASFGLSIGFIHRQVNVLESEKARKREFVAPFLGLVFLYAACWWCVQWWWQRAVAAVGPTASPRDLDVRLKASPPRRARAGKTVRFQGEEEDEEDML